MEETDLNFIRESVSLRQRVVECLRDAILYGKFAPGQKLVERDLCNMLDVSLSLLREALQQLQAEGLIVTVIHKGPSVATMSAQDAANIYQIREALEAMAAQGFANNASDVEVARLRSRLEDLKKLGESASSKDLVVTKNAFYDTLLNGCGNQVIGQVLTHLNNRATLLRRWSMSTPGRLPKMLAELELVVVAIENRDGPNAGSLCARHVRNAAAVVQEHFRLPEQTTRDVPEAPLILAGAERVRAA